MKLKLLSLSTLLVAGVAYGQSTPINNEGTVMYNSLGQKVTVIPASDFAKTQPYNPNSTFVSEPIEPKEMEDGRREFYLENYEEILAQGDGTVDPVVQTEMGTRQLKTAINSWLGNPGTNSFPPDPSGAAGANHYVQASHMAVKLYDKTGQIVIPGGTLSLNSFWPGSTNMGDPIVMYDKHADRWFVSQFQSGPNQILIAISETNDPTGAFYSYTFNFNNFPDYPKYSVWWDGYYMTSNSNHTAVVFDRAKMLAGDPTATAQILSLPSLGNGGFRSPLPSDADGDLPPNGTPCYFFNLEDNAFSGVSQDQIEIYEMVTDWNNPGNTQVASSQQLSVPSFDSMFSGGWSNIAQPGTGQGLDAIMGVFMYRAQHMRWTGYNTVMLSHAVDLGGNRSGIRWYELRDANDGNWTVFQSGTYAPDNTASRWMSSIAMDTWGNIGLGYTISDPTNTIYPSLAYTGRLGTDASGDMSFAEQIVMTGLSSQTNTDRFGDYAHLSLDPVDGKTFFYTGEFMNTGGNHRTGIFSFSIFGDASIDESNPYYANLSMVAFQNEANLNVSVNGIYNDEKVDLDIIDMSGKTIYSSGTLQPTQSVLNETINITNFESGVYFVRIGNKNFQEVERMFIKN